MRTRLLEPDDLPLVSELHRRRAVADGRPALSEHKAVRLGRNSQERIVTVDGEIVGSAHAAWHPAERGQGHWAVESVVDPARSDGPAILALLLAEVMAALPGTAPVTWWAWRPDELEHAADARYPEHRSLQQMARTLPVDAAVEVPDGVSLARFRPGVDDAAWLAANNAAFAGHPENGALDADDLALRMAQPWFDPEGFIVGWRGDDLIGFCWTKLHAEAVGEIYIVGVVPAAQGIGLGRALVLAGLDDLVSRQRATTAMLWVGAEDRRAITLYERLGFSTVFVNREFVVRGRGGEPS
jgi:mycothiol synthase